MLGDKKERPAFTSPAAQVVGPGNVLVLVVNDGRGNIHEPAPVRELKVKEVVLQDAHDRVERVLEDYVAANSAVRVGESDELWLAVAGKQFLIALGLKRAGDRVEPLAAIAGDRGGVGAQRLDQGGEPGDALREAVGGEVHQDGAGGEPGAGVERGRVIKGIARDVVPPRPVAASDLGRGIGGFVIEQPDLEGKVAALANEQREQPAQRGRLVAGADDDRDEGRAHERALRRRRRQTFAAALRSVIRRPGSPCCGTGTAG